jgi:tellurite resistance protein TerC
VIILTKLKISRERQQLALLIGIIFALVLRIIAISVGAAVIARFEAIFFVFGAFHHLAQRFSYMQRVQLTKKIRKKVALFEYCKSAELSLHHCPHCTWHDGSTFALDSIPAIFGLTQNVYIVITANVFALMGLRQLYFLIGGLMERLVHIGRGLSVVLGFIGIKLIFHAMHAVGLA